MNYLNEPPMDYPKCKPLKFLTQKFKNQFVCSCSNLLGTIFKLHRLCMYCVPFILIWKTHRITYHTALYFLNFLLSLQYTTSRKIPTLLSEQYLQYLHYNTCSTYKIMILAILTLCTNNTK